MTKLPLEEFSALFAPDAPDPIAKARDAGRAEGYDNGYTSGWDDAMRAVEDKGRQVSDELLRAVQDAKLTTTSAAARAEAEALSVLSALMEQAIEPVLPEALALRVQQEVASVLNSAMECEVILATNGDTAERLARLLKESVPDVSFRKEDTLADNQVVISSGRQDKLISFAPLLEVLRSVFAQQTAVPKPVEVPHE